MTNELTVNNHSKTLISALAKEHSVSEQQILSTALKYGLQEIRKEGIKKKSRIAEYVTGFAMLMGIVCGIVYVLFFKQ